MKPAELTTAEAVRQAKEWQENSEMMIAPEIVTALIEGCERTAAFDALLRAAKESRTLIFKLKRLEEMDRMSLAIAVDLMVGKLDTAITSAEKAAEKEQTQ